MREWSGYPLTPALSPAVERREVGASSAGERGDFRRRCDRSICPSSIDGSRRGFTLLEVIIALSLSVLLLTAVYGAIRMQYRISQSGREQMEQAQLSRAILRLIESDVRSVVWQVQKPPQAGDEEGGAVEDDATTSNPSSSSGTTAGSTFGTLSSSGSSTSSLSRSAASPLISVDDAGGSTGIFGDAQTLVLHINRPPRERVYATSLDGEAEAAGRGDLASVSYYIADGTAGGVSAAVASQGSSTSALGGGVGLARMEEDRLSMTTAGTTTAGTATAGDAIGAMPGTAKVIAPEVTAIEFAYWDGLEWLESWDSAASGTLPSAIGITLSIDTRSTIEDRALGGGASPTGTTGPSAQAGEPVQVRYVIAVPLAEPYVSEASI